MDIRQNVLQFKMQLLRFMPFYGDILMRLPIQESKSIDTAATDGRLIVYNPDFFATLNEGQQNFVLMHELFHVLLQHARRSVGKKRNRVLWNTACDLVINSMLFFQVASTMRSAGIPFEAPPDGLYMRFSPDSVAENIYATLKRDNTGNRPLKKVLLVLNNRFPREITPGDDLLPGTDEMQEQQITDMIRNALKQVPSSQPGYGSYFVPPSVYKLYGTKPLNWQVLLRNMLEQRISDDSSYATPERKYLHMDLILPGHTASEEVLEEVWIFIDSSGSISHDTMASFLTQVHSLLKTFECTMNIVYWDTQVTDIYRNIRKKEELKDCLPKHSGGTDINCVYRWIRQNKIHPNAMLILTDGYFGQLTETEMARRLKRKTVLILSEEQTVFITDDIGKIARLTTE